MIKKWFKQFGGPITKRERRRLRKSNNFNGKQFENLEETSMDINPRTLPGLLKKQFTNTESRTPKEKLPIRPFDKEAFLAESNTVKFIWYGHAVLLFRIDGKTILFDPMFGEDASPIAPIRTERFSTGTLNILRQLPEMDIVLLSHDHYDHLDKDSIKILSGKTKQFIVPIGVARTLRYWGVARTKIQELDWYESALIDYLEIHFTPSRHFSGRGLRDKQKSLWGGYVLKTEKQKIYITGDGGYGKHFHTVAEKYGPFDFCFAECGQYNEEWHQIHMYPEEAVQAVQDAGAHTVMPIHWGSFKLAMHPWKEPVERFISEADKKQVNYCVPRLGEIVEIGQSYPTQSWWESFE